MGLCCFAAIWLRGHGDANFGQPCGCEGARSPVWSEAESVLNGVEAMVMGDVAADCTAGRDALYDGTEGMEVDELLWEI